MMKMNRNLGPTLIGAFLTIASVWIVIAGAQNEPYFAPTTYDAFTQIGVAGSLIAGWILFAIWLMIQIRRKQLAALWSAAMIWIFIVIFYLQASPMDFL